MWNPGWERGIRIGDLKTGWLKAFIPDEEATRGAGTEFVGVDARYPKLLLWDNQRLKAPTKSCRNLVPGETPPERRRLLFFPLQQSI